MDWDGGIKGELWLLLVFFFIVVILGNRYLKCSIFINHTLDQWRTSCLNQCREGAQPFPSCKGPPGIQTLNTRGSEGLLLPTYLQTHSSFLCFHFFPQFLNSMPSPSFFAYVLRSHHTQYMWPMLIWSLQQSCKTDVVIMPISQMRTSRITDSGNVAWVTHLRSQSRNSKLNLPLPFQALAGNQPKNCFFLPFCLQNNRTLWFVPSSVCTSCLKKPVKR